ncbi:MAG: peptidase M23 [Helicobacteraceae bacterium CG2_30_36_10]|nr:MAG: peptidase M23 [Helicobacteraceae bacterium CG2_30_36_10]
MKRDKNGLSLGVLLLLSAIIGVAIYLYNSSLFERAVPVIELHSNDYWNLKDPLKITIDDNSGVQSYKVTLKTANEQKPLNYEQLLEPLKSLTVSLEPIQSAYSMKETNIKIIVEATDASKWNFFKGNSTTKVFDLKIDKTKPQVNIVANSYKITKGGAALVIFKATDDNLKDIYIQTSFDKVFKVQPFYKEGYYISLLAWPVTQNSFKATVVCTDKAGNITKSYIPLYLKEKSYRSSDIKLRENFLKGKIAQLAQVFDETQGTENSLEQFKIINEDVRAKNEKLIHEVTSKISDVMIKDFKINKMYPLKNAQVVANFGDHRKYSYDGQYISESYHLGLDLASIAMAEIRPQNSGDVVYSDFNGLYGNMQILHHGLGLYTLYGHCSSVNVSRGDFVNKNINIANTGKSGYAMGDHLHFGVLVQGLEVRPAEWMDKVWIKLNITDVIDKSKEIINRS